MLSIPLFPTLPRLACQGCGCLVKKKKLTLYLIKYESVCLFHHAASMGDLDTQERVINSSQHHVDEYDRRIMGPENCEGGGSVYPRPLPMSPNSLSLTPPILTFLFLFPTLHTTSSFLGDLLLPPSSLLDS